MVAMPASILRRQPVEPLGDLAIVAAAAKRGYSLGSLLPMPCCEGAFRFRSSLSIMDWTRRIAKSFSFVTVFPVRTCCLLRTAKPEHRLVAARAQR